MKFGLAPACRGESSSATVALFALSAIVSLALTSGYGNAAELKRWADGTVPHFVLPAASGPDVKLDAHRGRVVLVHFFATWCEPCREELPALRRLVERATPSSMSVLAISVAEVDVRVQRFLETMPVNFPVLLDRDRAVAKAWKVSTLPSTILLDSKLKPRLAVDADFAWDRIELKQLIAMLGPSETLKTIKPNTKGG